MQEYSRDLRGKYLHQQKSKKRKAADDGFVKVATSALQARNRIDRKASAEAAGVAGNWDSEYMAPRNANGSAMGSRRFSVRRDCYHMWAAARQVLTQLIRAETVESPPSR